MPIYEYHCPKCGTFETTQRITDPALKRCPTCKSKVERMISATSFVLKGSGWYATDYARSGSGKGGDSSNDKSGTSRPLNPRAMEPTAPRPPQSRRAPLPRPAHRTRPPARHRPKEVLRLSLPTESSRLIGTCGFFVGHRGCTFATIKKRPQQKISHFIHILAGTRHALLKSRLQPAEVSGHS